MSATGDPPQARADLAPEDRARADFYALIARLLYAAPDADLLAAIAAAREIPAEGGDAALGLAWNSLVAAAAAMDAEAAREEYDSVFVGTGKAEVTPYASGYMADSTRESTLVRLRAELAALGLGRVPGAAEYEDHFASLCEVMRHLILLSGTADAAVHDVKEFFIRYIGSGYAEFCAAVAASPNTNFYKHVARFTKAYFDVETESFNLAQ